MVESSHFKCTYNPTLCSAATKKGGVIPRGEGRSRQVNPNVEYGVIKTHEDDPTNSIRRIAQQVWTSTRTVHRTLQHHLLHLYYLYPVQRIFTSELTK